MLARRIPLLLVGILALLAGSGSKGRAAKLDPRDLLGSLRRLQHSRAPEARAILHVIESGPRDLAFQRSAARHEGLPLTPAELQPPSPPPALNAAPIYAQLRQVLRERPIDQRGEETLSWMGARFTHTPGELAAARQFLAARPDVMNLIHQAADRPWCVFHHPWKFGLGLIFTEGATMREAERLLKGEGYLLAQEGRYSEAIADQARGFRIAEHAASDPTEISLLVGIACDALTLDGMKDILYLAGPNAGVADAVRTTLTARRPRFSLRAALEGETVTALAAIQMLRRAGPKALPDYLGVKPPAHLRPPTLQDRQLFTRLWDAAEADFIRQMRHAMVIADQTYPARLTRFKRLDQQFGMCYSIPTDHPVRLLLSVLVSLFEPTAANAARARAREDVVVAGAALLAYQGQHGVWPVHLEEAIPAPPLDPFSGQPVKYHQEGQGFVVYSVGPSGTFDGSDRGPGRRGAEIFFRYPAPPPQPHPAPQAAPAQSGYALPSFHKYAVEAVAFSPDGKWLATGSVGQWAPQGDDDPKLRLWEVQTGKPLWARTADRRAVDCVAFSLNGQRIASGSGEGTVSLWDAPSGKLERTLPGHKYGVNSVAFSPDGRRLASVGSDTLKVWDVRTGRLRRTLSGQGAWLESVAFSPVGKLVAGGSHDSTIRLWNARTGRLLRTLKGHMEWVKSLAFAPGGKRLASGSGDGTVKLWNVRTGRLLWTTAGTAWVNSIAFSPDGKLVASGHDGEFDKHDNTVKIWDAQTGTLQRTLKRHRYEVNSVAFSPDGTRLASGSDDATVKLWDVQSGVLLRTISATPPRGTPVRPGD